MTHLQNSQDTPVSGYPQKLSGPTIAAEKDGAVPRDAGTEAEGLGGKDHVVQGIVCADLGETDPRVAGEYYEHGSAVQACVARPPAGSSTSREARFSLSGKMGICL